MNSIYELHKNEAGDRFLTAVILVPSQPDLQNDEISPLELERACHRFNEGPRKLMKNHSVPFDESEAKVVESYILESDTRIGSTICKAGSWVCKIRVTEELYQAGKSGRISGFSVGGSAQLQE